jgi:hypothetical protein
VLWVDAPGVGVADGVGVIEGIGESEIFCTEVGIEMNFVFCPVAPLAMLSHAMYEPASAADGE